MKFLGQHIYDLISRFRNDVFLEDIADGTVANDKFLGLDSNNKIVKEAISVGDANQTITMGVSDSSLSNFGQIAFGTTNVNLTFEAGEGIDLSTSISPAAKITIAGEEASTSNKGVASFSSDNFDVSSGAVNIKSGGVDLTDEVTGVLPVSNGGTGASSLASGKVLVGNGTSTVSAGGASGAFRYTDLVGFTVPVDTMTVVSTNAADPQLHLTMSPSGATATGPSLRFIKDFSSGAGADDDVIGDIIYVSDDDAGAQTIFSQVTATISDASNGQESGLYDIKVAAHGGGLAKGLSILGGSQDDEVDVSIATGVSSVTTIAGTLTMGNTAFVNNSGVIQVATQGTIDHDSLANFVANEHIDWTSSSAGTIHSTNIPTLNQNTSGTAAGLSSTLAVGSGGTGATSLTDNAVLLGNGSSAIEASSHLSYTIFKLGTVIRQAQV